MNIQLNYPETSQTFNFPTFSTPSEYYDFEPNTILNSLRHTFELPLTKKKRQRSVYRKCNTTDFFQSVIFYGCGTQLTNNTASLRYTTQSRNWVIETFEDFNEKTLVLGVVSHYTQVLLTKIIHNGEVVFVLHNKTAKGNKYYSQSTSTYVGKIKRMLDYYKLKYVMKNYPKTTDKKIIITALEADDPNEKCGITLETSKYLVKTDCGHNFDEKALKEWFYTKLEKDETPDCPLCRTKLEINYSLVGECKHKYLHMNGQIENLYSQRLDALLFEKL